MTAAASRRATTPGRLPGVWPSGPAGTMPGTMSSSGCSVDWKARFLVTALIVVALVLTGCATATRTAPREAITVDEEVYALPPGVRAASLVWTMTPQSIIWAAPGEPVMLRVTPRRPEGGPLAEGARDLVQALLGGEDSEIASRIVRMDAAGDWVAYTTEGSDQADGAMRWYDLYLVNLKQPTGSIQIGSARLSRRGRFLSALSPQYAVWQAYSPEGPGDRYTLGQTQALQMEPQTEWDLPTVGWAERLRIEGGTLVAERPGGIVVRHRLRVPVAALDESAILTADFDGDGRADAVVGRRDRPRFYQTLRVVGADGRVLLDLASYLGPQLSAGVIASVWAADVGGPRPVLLVGDIGGSGGQGLTAFAYSPDQRQMAPVSWDGEPQEWGFASLDPATHTAIIAHRTYDYVRHMQYVAYTWRDGRLGAVDRWYGPRPEELSYPSGPTFVLLAAFTSVSLGLAEETPRYFTDRTESELFYRAVSGLAAPGAAWATTVNKGVVWPADLEAAPFTVQAPNGRGGQVTVRGEVSFVKRGKQHLISKIRIIP